MRMILALAASAYAAGVLTPPMMETFADAVAYYSETCARASRPNTLGRYPSLTWDCKAADFVVYGPIALQGGE